MNKKFLLIALIVSVFATNVFALPGFTEYLPTVSGQYVYYRDYSFKDETYIGFLYYDEEAINARLVQLNVQKVPTTNVEILISLDATKDVLEFTGEKSITEIGSDTVTIINYMHDMIYELHARRRKIPALTAETYKASDNYAQFGGDVLISYDYKVPFFNVLEIRNVKGDLLLQTVCINALQSSEDTSFSKFAGFPELPAPQKDSKTKAKKMDKLWKTAAENMWLMGNDAFSFSSQTQLDTTSIKKDGCTVYDYFSRAYLLSSTDNYNYFPANTFSQKSGALVVSTMQYNAKTKRWTKDIKTIKDLGGDKYKISGLTVYYDYYQKNKKYFDAYLENLIK